MLTKNSSEAAIRICAASIAIAAGTFFLFAGMTNTTIDGKPFSYPLLEHFNLLAWSAPSLAAIAYLILWRDFRLLSWLFTAFCVYWTFKAYNTYSNNGYKFSYHHQGDVVSSGCDRIYFALSGATLLFATCGFAVLTLLTRHRKKSSAFRTTSGGITFILLLYFSFAVAIS